MAIVRTSLLSRMAIGRTPVALTFCFFFISTYILHKNRRYISISALNQTTPKSDESSESSAETVHANDKATLAPETANNETRNYMDTNIESKIPSFHPKPTNSRQRDTSSELVDDNHAQSSTDNDGGLESKLIDNNFGECLHDLKEVLDSLDQKFFLACGTALGYVRDKSFIQSDGGDIDVGVFSEDFDFEKVSAAFAESDKFEVWTKLGKINESLEVQFMHNNNVRADIFLHYRVDRASFYVASFFGICDEFKEEYCKWKHTINGLKAVRFNGGEYLIPANAEEYLEELYGSNWRTPINMSYWEGLEGGYTNKMPQEKKEEYAQKDD